MFAINKAADLLVSANTQKQVILFYSDSHSSLLQLEKDQSTSKLTLDTVTTLNILGKMNQYLHKVAAHTGIAGDERADELTRKVLASPQLDQSPSSV